MREMEPLHERIRRSILGQLHVGRLAPGERLPSIRRVAAETGVDHRTVAAAYRVLEEEGLVEVRSGSGVYVARGGGRADGPAAERWLAEVLTDGWSRRMGRRELGRLLQGVTDARVRCAVVESNEDHMVALAAELEDDFAVETTKVMVEPDAASLPAERLNGADLVVTTVFHAELGRAAARAAGKPAVVAVVDPDFVAELERRLARGAVTAVIADPRFRARGEAFLGVTAHPGRVRFVPVSQLPFAIPEVALHDEAAVLITRAARRLLGLAEYHLVPPPATVLSPDTARELNRSIVRLALGR